MKNLTFLNLFKKDSLLLFAKIFMPGVLILIILVAFSGIFKIEFNIFSQDAVQLLYAKAYMGILSSIGIIVCSFTTAILLFCYTLFIFYHGDKQHTSFLFYSTLITFIMLVDDAFMLHDYIFPDSVEKLFYIFYGSSVLMLVYYFRKIVLNSDYILLILSFGLLASSVVSDIVALFIDVPHILIFEDSFKFLGIISWFAYFIRICYRSSDLLFQHKRPELFQK